MPCCTSAMRGPLAAFYREALDFEVVAEVGDGAGVFLKAAGTDNHHDLGLFSLGPQAPLPQRGRVGLYHLAWQVDSIHDLAEMRERLDAPRCARRRERPRREQVAVRARSRRQRVRDHVGRARARTGAHAEHDGVVAPLDLDADLARYG